LQKQKASARQQQGSKSSEKFAAIPHHMGVSAVIGLVSARPFVAPRPPKEKETGKQNYETSNLAGLGLTPTPSAYKQMCTPHCRTLTQRALTDWLTQSVQQRSALH